MWKKGVEVGEEYLCVQDGYIMLLHTVKEIQMMEFMEMTQQLRLGFKVNIFKLIFCFKNDTIIL